MKHLLTLVVMLGALGLSAQEYKSRQPTPTEWQKLAGATEFVQDTWLRDNRIFVLNTNLQPVLTLTNIADYGTFYVAPTNAELSGAFTIGLPNPTNNLYRTLRFITPDGCHIVLSNSHGTASANGFRDMTTHGVSNIVWLVTSNKVTTLYSTGTNYLVKVQ